MKEQQKARTICSRRRGKNRFLVSTFIIHRAPEHARKRRAARDPYAELSESNALTSMYYICDENAPRVLTRASLTCRLSLGTAPATKASGFQQARAYAQLGVKSIKRRTIDEKALSAASYQRPCFM